MPNFDSANPSPWLASLRASRRRRAEAALQPGESGRPRRGGRPARRHDARRRRGRRRGRPGRDGRRRGHGRRHAQAGAGGSTVAALQRALGVPADGVFGPRHPPCRPAVPALARPRRRRHRGPGDARRARHRGVCSGAGATKRSTTRSGSASTLARIARCESGGDPTAISSSGRYRGKYQFSRATWRDLGGKGDPAAAPESVQDAMAAKLLAQRGTTPWPVCG